jgi:hypothetical protein
MLLYIFLDEGGNFDFSPTGTRYFTLTSMALYRPFSIREAWDDYRYELLEFGRDLEYFHCTEDNRFLRDRLFAVLNSHAAFYRIDSLIIEKAKVCPIQREDQRFYPEMLGFLLKHIFEYTEDYDEVIIITDNLPHQKKRKAVEKGIKQTLKWMLPTSVKYQVLHHASRAHYCLQAADYCNWAIYRKWNSGDLHYYDQIKPAIRTELEILSEQSQRYY